MPRCYTNEASALIALDATEQTNLRISTRPMTLIAWGIFALAAIFEVAGDATIRTGLRSHRWLSVVIGAIILGLYGIVVNMVRWDFSKLLGVYVAVFALVSVLAGAVYFQERIPASTWLGLAMIIIGGLTIQFGAK